jgi:hypothetical protein
MTEAVASLVVMVAIIFLALKILQKLWLTSFGCLVSTASQLGLS